MGGNEIVPSHSLAMGRRATADFIGRSTRSSDPLSPRPRRKYESEWKVEHFGLGLHRSVCGGGMRMFRARPQPIPENVTERQPVLQTIFTGCFSRFQRMNVDVPHFVAQLFVSFSVYSMLCTRLRPLLSGVSNFHKGI